VWCSERDRSPPGGRTGDGRAISLSSLGVNHGGLFWFFNAANPEMLVKIVDACAVDQKFWIFSSAGTNVGLTTTIRDTATGAVRTYSNPDRTAAPPVQDTRAFDCVGGKSGPATDADVANDAREEIAPPAVLAPQQADTARALPGAAVLSSFSAPAAGCLPGPATLCIGDRFKVEVVYQTAQGGGRSGMGQAVALDSLGVSRGGLFWFFSPDNPEMLVKVIDACALSGKYWVFYSAGTNVGLRVRVTDTTTGRSATYSNPDLTAAPPVQDTSALPCS
jgi:hypothetical protein